MSPFQAKSLTSPKDRTTYRLGCVHWCTDYLELSAWKKQQMQGRLLLNPLICLKSGPSRNSAVTDLLLESSPMGMVDSCHRRGDTASSQACRKLSYLPSVLPRSPPSFLKYPSPSPERPTSPSPFLSKIIFSLYSKSAWENYSFSWVSTMHAEVHMLIKFCLIFSC